MKNLLNKKNKVGFTLVEILFGISIFIIILLAITLFSRNIWVYNSFISSSLSDADTGRQVIKTMVAEIRTASAGSDGAYAISAASANSFTFYADINDDGLKEKIRYFLNGTLLQKGVIVPTSSPLGYVAGNEKVTTVLTGVTNSTIFDYYNGNYDGTTAALMAPIDVAAVRLVKITLVVDQNPNASPAATTFSTQVTLRNLKDNL